MRIPFPNALSGVICSPVPFMKSPERRSYLVSERDAGVTPPATVTVTAVPAGGAMAIELVDMTYQPAEMTIAANAPVTIVLKNPGKLLHNFSIDVLRISEDVSPGETRRLVITAPAGVYRFYCNVPGHEAAGTHLLREWWLSRTFDTNLKIRVRDPAARPTPGVA